MLMVFLSKLLHHVKPLKVPFFVILAIVPVLWFSAMKSHQVSDTNQSFVHYGKAQKELIQFMEEENLYDQDIFAPFLIAESLRKRYAGYKSNDKQFTRILYTFNSDKEFYNIKSSRNGESVSPPNLINRQILWEKEFISGQARFVLQKLSTVSD
jgi:hypothetical protein